MPLFSRSRPEPNVGDMSPTQNPSWPRLFPSEIKIIMDVHACVRPMQGIYDLSGMITVLWLAIDEAEPLVYVRFSSSLERREVLL